jgi:methyl-accepting chemotaxis protein
VIGIFQRRQLFVHPIQYWFIGTTLIYVACLLIMLYAVIFLPMVEPLYDPSLSWEQHAQVASQFLELNARVWPWLLITFLVLLLHSLYFMHRIAGPLYRFSTLFRSIGTGNLHQRARLRKHDYLHREAQAFNTMLDSLENRIKTIHLQSALVSEAYETVAVHAQAQASGKLTFALRALDEEIRRFKSYLATVELRREGQPEQQRFDFDEASQRDSPTIMKAA